MYRCGADDLHDRAGVLVEGADEALTERLLAPATDGFGGLITHRDNPKLFLVRLMHQPIFTSPEEDVMYLTGGPHDGDGCEVQVGTSFDAVPVPLMSGTRELPSEKGARCSFCGSTHDQVQAFIAGPGIRTATRASISATRSSRSESRLALAEDLGA